MHFWFMGFSLNLYHLFWNPLFSVCLWFFSLFFSFSIFLIILCSVAVRHIDRFPLMAMLRNLCWVLLQPLTIEGNICHVVLSIHRYPTQAPRMAGNWTFIVSTKHSIILAQSCGSYKPINTDCVLSVCGWIDGWMGGWISVFVRSCMFIGWQEYTHFSIKWIHRKLYSSFSHSVRVLIHTMPFFHHPLLLLSWKFVWNMWKTCWTSDALADCLEISYIHLLFNTFFGNFLLNTSIKLLFQLICVYSWKKVMFLEIHNKIDGKPDGKEKNIIFDSFALDLHSTTNARWEKEFKFPISERRVFGRFPNKSEKRSSYFRDHRFDVFVFDKYWRRFPLLKPYLPDKRNKIYTKKRNKTEIKTNKSVIEFWLCHTDTDTHIHTRAIFIYDFLVRST